MKAALQNMVLYLLCLASVVLAAPHQSTLCSRPSNTGRAVNFSIPQPSERPVFTQAKEGIRSDASLLEGSARFELW